MPDVAPAGVQVQEGFVPLTINRLAGSAFSRASELGNCVMFSAGFRPDEVDATLRWSDPTVPDLSLVLWVRGKGVAAHATGPSPLHIWATDVAPPPGWTDSSVPPLQVDVPGMPPTYPPGAWLVVTEGTLPVVVGLSANLTFSIAGEVAPHDIQPIWQPWTCAGMSPSAADGLERVVATVDGPELGPSLLPFR